MSCACFCAKTFPHLLLIAKGTRFNVSSMTRRGPETSLTPLPTASRHAINYANAAVFYLVYHRASDLQFEETANGN